MQTETLAQKLGTRGHGSRLLLKAQQAGLHGPQALLDEAIARGCFHYLQGRTPPLQRVSLEALSNMELALALLTPANLYDPWLIRVGAMMQGAEGNDPAQIAQLAVDEGCEQVVRAIAEAGVRYEPDAAFWKTLLDLLPPSLALKPGVLPHHSRYVSTPGLTGPRTRGKAVWLRPAKLKAFGYAG
ncbi:MAG: hypothetical protein ACKVY0_18595 [Prosthecobacter sp.]|uniref:hypothetical protein n=1 Tax=Prosthecobacter sp. TaxID=1965333 RepID=UPI0039028133